MRRKPAIYALSIMLFAWLLSGFLTRQAGMAGRFPQPTNFPPPVYKFNRNPFSASKVELGRRLFYDGLLSKNNTISCGTCHIQASAFSHHGHRLSHGIFDSLGARNAPALQNLAWSTSFMWDGGVNDLDLQPFVPMTSHVEMGETVENIVAKLKVHPDYPKYFLASFGTKEIRSVHLMQALSQFMVSMVSAGSKYDKVSRKEEGSTYTAGEAAGYALYQSKCASCHAEPLFTDHSFRSNGIVSFGSDWGRMTVTTQETDKHKFKVPSLRNVALTGPYMHDGRFKTLDQVLDHYASGIQPMPGLDPLLVQPSGRAGIPLTAADKASLKAFLHTLTDSAFISNAALSELNICPDCIKY